MNAHDSEKLKELITSEGCVITHEETLADVIVLNTCAVREKAEQKVYSRLGRLSQLKLQKPTLTLIVAGCMAQAWGKKILDRAPYVDLIVGPGSFSRIVELADDLQSGLIQTAPSLVDIKTPTSFIDIEPDKLSKPSSHHAWITIMEGCNNYCSYCVVPYVRGRERSRDVHSILQEVNRLVDLGVREITLLGQNVNSFRSRDCDFPELLRRLNDISQLMRIRYTTSHPKDVSSDLIASMATLSKVCEFLHFPAQSGSNSILDRMRRGYTREEYLKQVNLIRSVIPKIALSSDFIVGFPGETQRDYDETMDLVKFIRYDSIFAFHYSVRPMTRSAQWADDVPYSTKLKRLNQLITLQRNISLQRNSEWIGQTVEVLVEGAARRGDGKYTGRTRQNRIVNFSGTARLSCLQNVMIQSVSPNCLYGITR